MKKTFSSRILLFSGMLLTLLPFFLLFSFKAGAYTNDPDTCTHPGLCVETFDYPADCCNFAHRDRICSLCGTVVSTQRTGSELGNHVYDYEDILNYGYEADTCVSYCTSTIATVHCKVCHNYVKVAMDAEDFSSVLFHGLEQHKGLDTENKFFDTESNAWVYTCKTCGNNVYALIQSDRPYYTAGTVDPDTCVHQYEIASQKEPTCTENGYIEYFCPVCTVTHIEILKALGHDYGTEEITVAPTCSSEGQEKRVCSRCSLEETVILPVSDHNYGDEPTFRIAPTCTKEGIEIYTCIHCGTTKNIILPKDPNAHTFTDTRCIITMGTCQKKSVLSATCSECGAVVQFEGDYTGHSYVILSKKEATCGSEGLICYQCSVCGAAKEENIPRTDIHDFVYTGECTESSHVFVCSVCGSRITMEHTFTEAYLSDDSGHWHECLVCHCRKDTGIHQQIGSDMTCITCGRSLTSDETHLHSLVYVPGKEATCAESGTLSYYICSGCNRCFSDAEAKNQISLTETEIAPLGHDIVTEEMVFPTCTQVGMTEEIYCRRCGDILVKREVIEKTGHTEVKTEDVPATCTETGLAGGTHCSVCGVVLKEQEVIPATGHTYGEWESKDDSVHVRTCSCGAAETQEHEWDSGHKISGDYSGNIYYTCTVCGEQKTEQESSGMSTLGCTGKIQSSVLLFSSVAFVTVFFLRKKKHV